jgi:hypothetical protein
MPLHSILKAINPEQPKSILSFLLFWWLWFWCLFFHFGEGWPLHNVQWLISGSTVKYFTIRFSISSTMASLEIMPQVLPIRHSSCLVPQFYIQLLQSGLLCHLVLTFGALWLWFLCCAGIAQWVIHLWAAAKFCMTHHHPGPISPAIYGALWPDAGFQTGPSEFC